LFVVLGTLTSAAMGLACDTGAIQEQSIAGVRPKVDVDFGGWFW
jgi:hypothetical protein